MVNPSLTRRAFLSLAMLCLAPCWACSEPPTPTLRVEMDMAVDVGNAPDEDDLGPELPGPRRSFALPTAPEPDLTACGAISLGDALNVCTASYLGGAGADTVSHVQISPDGEIVLGGVFPGIMGFGPQNTTFGFGGDASVVKLSPDGRTILAWAHMGSLISALAVSPQDGSVAVGGDFGLVVLDAQMQGERFRFVANAPERLSFGLAGELLHFAGNQATVYATDAGGEVLASFAVEEGEVEDMVLDSAYQRVIVTGFEQVSADLQQPFVSAHDFDGSEAWSLWSFDAEQASAHGSDSRGVALAIGRDGKLYFAGEAHGGETVFRQDPRDVTRPLEALVAQDAYAQTSNLEGAAPMSFVSRHDLRSGVIERATFLLTRRESDGRGNAARPSALAVNEHGDVLLGGSAACCIEDGAKKTVMGQEAMPGYAGGAFFVLLDGDTFERRLWTAAHGGAEAQLKSVDIWGGAAVVVHEHVTAQGESSLEGSMVLHESFFAQPQGGGSDIHITVFPVDSTSQTSP